MPGTSTQPKEANPKVAAFKEHARRAMEELRVGFTGPLFQDQDFEKVWNEIIQEAYGNAPEAPLEEIQRRFWSSLGGLPHQQDSVTYWVRGYLNEGRDVAIHYLVRWRLTEIKLAAQLAAKFPDRQALREVLFFLLDFTEWVVNVEPPTIKRELGEIWLRTLKEGLETIRREPGNADARARLEGVEKRLKNSITALAWEKATAPAPATAAPVVADPEARPKTQPGNAAHPPASKMLMGWKAVLAALQVDYSPEATRAWRRLNETEHGPICIIGKGKPPRVDQNKLLTWHKELTERAEVTRQKIEDTDATIAERFTPHKRDSRTVLPEIGGHTRHRVK
ncbi:MAG: hypothetical protein ABSE73_22035 [Planctomycetota bacterium]